MQERELLKSWATDVIQKAELYSEASIGMVHAELREQLREVYKSTPEIPDEVASRIAADRVVTKFASGTKTHTDAIAAYINNKGTDGPFEAAKTFATEVRSERMSLNGVEIG
jgi:hypothetical protein